MKKVLKWTGIILGSLFILLLVAAVGLSIAGSSRLTRTYAVTAKNITFPTDEAALARGEHLVNVFCRDCHTADLTGYQFFDQPPIGTIYSANITGLADTHTDEELVLAIRHGLDRHGRALMIMPADSFIHLSQEDLGSIVAYLKTVPRTGEEKPRPEIGPMGRILAGIGAFDSSFPASFIDHDQPFPYMPEPGANMAYGEYVSRFCQSCHGAALTGGQPSDPESPPGPNLTQGGDLAGWTEADFVTAIRTGMTPNGRQLNPAFMPWQSIAKLEDDELHALWMYLESLPPSHANLE